MVDEVEDVVEVVEVVELVVVEIEDDVFEEVVLVLDDVVEVVLDVDVLVEVELLVDVEDEVEVEVDVDVLVDVVVEVEVLEVVGAAGLKDATANVVLSIVPPNAACTARAVSPPAESKLAPENLRAVSHSLSKSSVSPVQAHVSFEPWSPATPIAKPPAGISIVVSSVPLPASPSVPVSYASAPLTPTNLYTATAQRTIPPSNVTTTSPVVPVATATIAINAFDIFA